MRAKELLQSARKTGLSADPRAGDAFKVAAVQLSAEDPSTEGRHTAGRAAAEALVSLALAEGEAGLRLYLSPDPTSEHVTWTVACYQIGDLTPTALRDFADPVEAVALLAACPEEQHVAAELLASTAQGLRWTAMTRINEELAFQLPDADTASDAAREHSTELPAALHRWREQLLTWGVRDAEITDEFDEFDESVHVEAVEARGKPDATSFPEAQLLSLATDNSRLVDIESRLGGIERSIAGLAGELERINASLAEIAKQVSARGRNERAPTIKEVVGAVGGSQRRRRGG